MTSEHITHCICCGSENIADAFPCQDHFVSREIFNISQCNTCGFHFTNPRPSLDHIGPYYESEDYVSHSKTSAGFINRLFHISRIYSLNYKKRVVSRYSEGNSLLDYGCGTGEFVHTMEKAAWNSIGIEPNATARKLASSLCKSEILKESSLDNLDKASFDAITLWHVMEHIYPIKDRIPKFHDLLSKQGTLFVALPNMLSYDAKKYGQYWAAWDVPRHIYHFSPESVNRLLSQFGFKMIKTKPMLLDAFYISMLSEKYRKGNPQNVNAVISGVQSNCRALFGNGNYSSLIYIFKKSE